MVTALKRHPFAVQAFFRHSLVLTYAVPREIVQPLMAAGLSPDCHGPWAFVAVAMVQTESLRPKGLPAWLGQSFFLTGYRVFVRFHAANGKTLRGLKVIRSDTDRLGMRWLGNAFTHYRYHKVRADVEASGNRLSVRVRNADGTSNLAVTAHLNQEGLPPNTVFADAKGARRFMGPMPFTFDYEPQTGSMVVVEGVRAEWNPRLVVADVSEVAFLKEAPFRDCEPVLSSVFYLHDVSYRWKPGVLIKPRDRVEDTDILK